MVNEEKFFVEILQSMKDFSFYVGAMWWFRKKGKTYVMMWISMATPDGLKGSETNDLII